MATTRLKLSKDAPLSKVYLAKAQKELHEKPSHVDAHITSLTRWIQSMPHLKCPDDKALYTAFLRHSKYDNSRAQQRIDNMATLRKSDSIFNRPSINDPTVMKYLDMGIHVPVGFLDDGTFLLIVRIGCWQPDLLTDLQLFTFASMQLDRMLEDPRVQIGGFYAFLDMSKSGESHRASLNPLTTGKKFLRALQEGYPLRQKAIIFYKQPAIMDFIMKIMIHWLKPKMRDRLFRVKDDPKKLFKKLPGLKSVLPKEYGGDNKSINELIKEQNEDFMEYYSKDTIWEGFNVDESKRPPSAKSLMKEYSFNEEMMGSAGTLIQLPEEE